MRRKRETMGMQNRKGERDKESRKDIGSVTAPE